MLQHYLANGAYWRLTVCGAIVNPDQRIAEDVRAFATSTLSFAIMAFNSLVTISAFAGVMLSISPVLSAVAVLYAVLGSGATLWLARPLVNLNYKQLDKEASFALTITFGRTLALSRELKSCTPELWSLAARGNLEASPPCHDRRERPIGFNELRNRDVACVGVRDVAHAGLAQGRPPALCGEP